MIRSFLFTLILGIYLTGCSERKTSITTSETNQIDTFFEVSDIEVPDIEVNKDELEYNPKKSTWTLHEHLYSGYVMSYYENGNLKEKFGILNGKKENIAIQFYENGRCQRISNYHKGRLHGAKKNWANDSSHTLLSHLNYALGKPHGEQQKWYSSGKLFKKMHLNMGKEEGLQQAFRENGALYANYEAKGGRIFGLKKAALCYSLKEENVQFRKTDEVK